MSRIGCQQVAGFYATPEEILPSCASILRWRSDSYSSPGVVLDPCAGEGVAVNTLREAWCREGDLEDGDIRVVACELEAKRASKCKKLFGGYRDNTHHGDAFNLSWDDGAGATALWLNPPYLQDKEAGRVELQFLRRFTTALHKGEGYLFFVVPGHVLVPSAEFLAQNYLDVRAWRFPGELFESYKQVLLVGRRATETLWGSRLERTIRGWGENPELLEELPSECPSPHRVELKSQFGLKTRLHDVDVSGAVQEFRPWDGTPAGFDKNIADLIGGRVQTAMPPKPTHVAMGLSAGSFNGHVLEPNSDRHPPLLAKGVFRREYVEVSQKRNKKGELIRSVQLERPRLAITALRLDTCEYHTLQAGTRPTGSDDLSEWNAADLIANYDQALARLLREQFPALHTPANPADQMRLPDLPRTPYKAQADGIQTGLKLLTLGLNPLAMAEVGTGKTTLALYIYAALTERYYDQTREELDRLGFAGRVPRVKRMLVMCPPHLLDTWEEETAAVVPWARVATLKTVSDLDKDADIYVISREAAKLGSGIRGIGGRCPRCGTYAGVASSNASRRARCKAITRQPANDYGKLAGQLATAMVSAFPQDPIVREHVRGRMLRRLLDRDPSSLNLGALSSVRREVVALVGDLVREKSRDLYDTIPIAEELALGTGAQEEVARALLDMWVEGESSSTWGPSRWLKDAAARLREAEVEEVEAHLKKALEALHGMTRWTTSEPCGEFLFQATAEPRRYPLSRRIAKTWKGHVQLVTLDEHHEFNNPASAQTKAAHRVASMPGVPTLNLSGSLCGGYASSLYSCFSAMSPIFQAEFGRSRKSKKAFIDKYGFKKVAVEYDGKKKEKTYGSQTDRETHVRVIGEAPGVESSFILKHVLPVAIVIHKSDLDVALPPLSESPVPILPTTPEGDELLKEYRRLEREVVDQIKKDRFCPERSGRLLGAMAELPSYLDRAAFGPFEIRYPEDVGGELVAVGREFPASWISPKEEYVLASLKGHLRRRRKVIVFLRHTGGAKELPNRLEGLIRKKVTKSVKWLDVSRVPTSKRQEWINQNVLAKNVQVLLVNPLGVQTGLNNLVSFATAIWYETPMASAQVWRQANGRIHRIGAPLDREVEVLLPYYAKTGQEIIMNLLARKTSASLQVDGLDLQAALEAAGASDDANAATLTAMAIGEAVYQQLCEAA